MELAARVDLPLLRKGLKDVQRKQIPFATSLALTSTAGHAAVGWQDEMRAVLDRPTPFTLGAVAVRPARKTRLIATVYLKDVAAAYLEPYLEGGPHFLGGKRGLLTPKNVPLNAYGNLTRGKLAQLKGRQGVYLGGVKLRSGQVVHGAWQRLGGRAKGGHHLKLLIRFSDPLAVTQRLDFVEPTKRAIAEHFNDEFAKAFNHAMATAR